MTDTEAIRHRLKAARDRLAQSAGQPVRATDVGELKSAARAYIKLVDAVLGDAAKAAAEAAIRQHAQEK